MVTRRLAFLLPLLLFTCFATCRFGAARLPQNEVDGLRHVIVEKMGSTFWEFDAETCTVGRVGMTPQPPVGSEASITCSPLEDNTSHVVGMVIKRFSLPGILPPELVQLPYLQTIDFAYNYLSGSIPSQWASLPLKSISVLVNRLSGEIPKELGNFTNLTELNLEANKFSGRVPPELGKLLNLESLLLSSNNLSGNLPSELAALKNLTDFRINDNNFNGTIPDFIQNWKQLTRLEMHASGLEGPIPSSISVLSKLKQLRISDINGRNQTFPDLSNMTAITRLVLRNCNIYGDIPEYIWGFKPLRVLDLSFNKLIGEIPDIKITESIKFIYLSGNFLSGKIRQSILMPGTNVDLSYNNFSWQGPEQPACTQSTNLILNLYRSSAMENNINAVSPCMQDLKCHRYWHSLHVNCGGKSEKIKGNKGDIQYEGDANVAGGASTLHLSEKTNWGFSSTGDFMDDNNFQNAHYIATLQSQNASELLYTSARIAPISLTYYRYCLENGSYNVSLHFAEIQFTNDETYSSLGRRVFDIYIQNTLVENDFNIEAEASGVAKPVIKPYNANVTNHILEIRLQWAGKGTTRIPDRSVYGPLISAISVDPNFIPRSEDGEKRVGLIIVGVVGSCLIFLALGIFWWRCYMREKNGREKDLGGLELQTGSFTLKQIKAATKNFDSVNKIGEGGFGSVFKGLLPDGTVIAVKQLSSKSNQGNREFLNEIGMISCLQHPNLVKLYGCCIEGDQMLVVYEYMENNSLACALFGPDNCHPKLDWPTRQKICIGIARGLAFIHEESRLKIVHRDIKGTNVLLDRDLNPKISDFGLAKLHEEEKTHISTRIAGTIGYMAPEYALWGYLTNKADVYSFGVVALEIASGKHNMSYGPENNCACLLDWACQLQGSGNLMELVDEKLESEFNKAEAERMIKVALICTNASPSLRPTMSEVVCMLEGTTIIPEVIPEASTYSQDLRFAAMRDHHKQLRNQSLRESQSHNSTSAHDLYSINEETYLAMRGDYVKPESQISTSVPSWVASSSTSARDLYSINSKSPR